MDNIPAVVNKTHIISAEFIRLTITNDSNIANNQVYTFSSSYKSEVIGGQTYSPMGGLLAVGVQQRDIKVTSADTSIALSGIDGNNIYAVLANKVKGSKVEITRGFYDDNYNLTSSAPRFTGIVTGYNISEDREELIDNFTVTLNASSYKTVLQNRIAGIKTNTKSWQEFYPTDTSMDQVYSIADQSFDFGKPVAAKAGTGSSAEADSSAIDNVANWGGGGPGAGGDGP